MVFFFFKKGRAAFTISINIGGEDTCRSCKHKSKRLDDAPHQGGWFETLHLYTHLHSHRQKQPRSERNLSVEDVSGVRHVCMARRDLRGSLHLPYIPPAQEKKIVPARRGRPFLALHFRYFLGLPTTKPATAATVTPPLLIGSARPRSVACLVTCVLLFGNSTLTFT